MPSQPKNITEFTDQNRNKNLFGLKRSGNKSAVILFPIFRNWLYLIATLGLCILGWSIWLMLQHPSSGISWSFTSGAVISVDPDSSASDLIQVGDRIISVDGIPVYRARFLPARKAGDIVVFQVENQNERREVSLTLAPPLMRELVKRISIIPICLSFWILGVIVLAFGKPDKLFYLFFLFCQLTTITLGLGAVSSYAPTWGWWLFGLLLWWSGPLTFHTHLVLSSSSNKTWLQKIFIPGLYALTLLFSLIDIVRLSLEVAGPFLTFKYLWVSILILASAGLLFFASIAGQTVDHRRKTRIAGISAAAAFLPFVFFSLIPDALTGQFIFPYEVTFLALPLLPLGYSYAILLYRLVQIEREISQSAAYALATLVIVTLYAFFYLFFSKSISLFNTNFSLIEMVIILAMIFAAHPIHQGLYRWLYFVFYGGWFDDRVAVKRIFQDLKYVKGDTYSIGQTLCETLQRTMWLEHVSLLLSDGRLITTINEQRMAADIPQFDPKQAASLFNNLQERTGRELGSKEELKDSLAAIGAENWDLAWQKSNLWLLFGGSSNWQGLLVLGSKRGRAEFSTRDLEILEVVVRQAGAALENERLLEEVRQRSNQVRELNRKVMWTREVERKRISRDLHDMVIQTLVGINYQLSNIRANNEPEMADDLRNIRNNLRGSMVDLRAICADLRPPALDVLGFLPALEARVTEIKSQVPFDIALNCDGLHEYETPDEIALCVYRFVQEALINVQKHSNANNVIIELKVEASQWLHILINDDGQGFTPPTKLEMFVELHHFGLVGLQEQVEAVGGQMEIKSTVGKGCRLSARIPLNRGFAST
jgi:signal transduction histidine kinase